MKVLITGALGHIGSRLIRYISEVFPGSEVVMIDNLISKRFSSIFNLPSKVKYEFIEADIKKINLDTIFKEANYVIHLAAITDAEASFKNAKKVESNNFDCTNKVAHACIDNNVKLVTLSSTSVYGTQKAQVTEDCSVEELKPQSPYAETKLKEEKLIKTLCDSEGLNAVCFRFGTIYGPSSGMRFHTAVNKFCWQATQGKPLTVWSTAFNQKRPYLDLSDAVRLIEFTIKKDLFDNQIYNILTENLTVREVTEVIKEFIPNLKIDFVDSKIMNQMSYEVSNKKIQDKGFLFEGGIRNGIKETISMLPR